MIGTFLKSSCWEEEESIRRRLTVFEVPVLTAAIGVLESRMEALGFNLYMIEQSRKTPNGQLVCKIKQPLLFSLAKDRGWMWQHLL